MRTSLDRRGTRLGYATAPEGRETHQKSEATLSPADQRGSKALPFPKERSHPRVPPDRMTRKNGELFHQPGPSRPRGIATVDVGWKTSTGKPVGGDERQPPDLICLARPSGPLPEGNETAVQAHRRLRRPEGRRHPAENR